MSLPNEIEIESLIRGIHSVLPLKQGGQKAVFKADHETLGQVVVKFVLDARADERIRREIEIVMSGNFPHVPRMYLWGEINRDGVPSLYVVEQYINGVDLRQAMADGPFPINRVKSLVGDLLETVASLETHAIVHRDIKPENIIAGDDGHFWLLDFGIARDLRRTSLTATGAHFGPHTAGYAAPEQFRNIKKRIDSRCDLFSLGVVAYEAATGRHPFAAGANGYLDVLRRTETLVVDQLAIDGDNSGAVSGFIHLLMEKFPSRRPPTATLARQWFNEESLGH